MLSMLAPLGLRLLDALATAEGLLAALTLRLLGTRDGRIALLNSLALRLLMSRIFGTAKRSGLVSQFLDE